MLRLPSPLLLLLAALLAILPPASWAITYADWIAGYSLTGAAALGTADPDGDGLPNLLEYALADCIPDNPSGNSVDQARLPKMVFGQRTGNGLPSINPGNITYTGLTPPPTGTFHIGLRYRPRTGTEQLLVEAQYSRDLLSGWFSGRGAFVVSPETPIAGDAVQWFLEDYTLGTFYLSGKSFLRLSVAPWENAPAVTIPSGGPQSPTAPAQGLLVLAPVATPRALEDTGSVSNTTVLDRTIYRVTASTSVTDYYWRWDALGTNTQPVTLTRTSSNTAVIMPTPGDPYGWQFVGNGTATLTLNTATSTYTTTVTTSTNTPQDVDTVTGFVSGSLRAHLVSQIDPLIAGLNKGTGLPIFTAQDHTAAIYVRNTACWASPYVGQLTAISPWNSQGGAYFAGVLVSPRHVLFATHYAPSSGTTIRFVAADNTVVTRTITALSVVGTPVNYYPDLTVGVLDSDVPGTIAFARILPDNWAAKLPTLTGTTAADSLLVPSLGLDQEEKAIVSDLLSISASVSFAPPANQSRRTFYEDKIGGDSGNPAFLIVNGQLVLMTCWTFGGGGSGTSVWDQRAAINAIMSAQGGGYQLTPVDLSSFPSY